MSLSYYCKTVVVMCIHTSSKHLWKHVTAWVCSPVEEKSRVFSEISGMMILVSIVCRKYEFCPESNATFFFHSQFILLKLQICHISAWIFVYRNQFFSIVCSKSMALCYGDARACMPLQYHSAVRCHNQLFTSEITSSTTTTFTKQHWWCWWWRK